MVVSCTDALPVFKPFRLPACHFPLMFVVSKRFSPIDIHIGHLEGNDIMISSEFISRHDVFQRKGREAARQSLYYLRLFAEPGVSEEDRQLVEGYARYGYRQIRALINGVHLQSAYWNRDALLEQADDAEKERLNVIFAEVDQWQDMIRDPLNKNPKLVQKDAAVLTAAFERFLEMTRKPAWYRPDNAFTLSDGFRYISKNLAFILSGIAALVIALFVPAVRNLLLNMGWQAIPMVLIFPFVYLLIRYIGRRMFPIGRAAVDSFTRVKYPSIEPEKGISRFPSTTAFSSRVFKGIALVQFAHLFALGGIILAAYMFWPGLSNVLPNTALSVFILLSVLYLLVIAGHSMDIVDFYDVRSTRFQILTAAFFLLIGATLTPYGIHLTAAFLAVVGLIFLAYYIRRRALRFRLILAILFLIGAFAMALNLLTRQREAWNINNYEKQNLERITEAEWPHGGVEEGPPIVLVAASGGGSRAAIYSALMLRQLNKDFPEIAGQLQAISSVSGGSLTNAAYVARMLEIKDKDAAEREAFRRERLNDLTQAVRQDFVLPTLIGSLVPFESRGAAIEHAWEEGPVGLKTTHLSDLAKAWRVSLADSADVPFPIPMFNSTSLDGHQVVISPFDKAFYTRPEVNGRAAGTSNAYDPIDGVPTWVFYRNGIYGLEDLLAQYDPRLSSSVRGSANFPFGFPLIQVETDRPLFFSPDPLRRGERRKTVHLTDGGALSNSGLWSLSNLMLNRADDLKKRGVLLIVVEASIQRPFSGVENRFTSLAGVIINRDPISQNLHRRWFDLLRAEYGDRIGIVQVDVIPRAEYAIMTTWALDRRSIELLEESFAIRWDEEKDNIRQVWQALKTGGSPKFNIRRPPRD